MEKFIPEKINISKCGSFCERCQFLIDEENKAFRCNRFSAVLWDDPYGSRPIRCDECLDATNENSKIRNFWLDGI